MSIARTVLLSVAAAALLFALPTHKGFGPDMAFGRGDGGGNGGGGGGNGGGGGGNGGGGHGEGGHGESGRGGGGTGEGASAGTGGAAGGAGSAAGGAASAGGNGGGNGGGNDHGALAAFAASPVFAHVAATVPTAITATPVVATRLGVQCQTVTQTVTIGGRDVHASAVLCRQPNGEWQIVPTRTARAGDRRPTRLELSALTPPSTER